MKILVLYDSVYGNSAQYAKWIAAAAGAELCPLSQAVPAALLPYDVLLFGGGIYASSIHGFKKFMKLWDTLQKKRLAVFAVGFSLYHEGLEEEIKKSNFKPPFDHVPCFYLRGALEPEALHFAHKRIVSLISSAAKKQGKPMETGDWKEKSAIAPVLQWISAQQY